MTAPASLPDRPFRVVILTDRPHPWGRYATRAAADDVVGKLRRHGFDARAIEPDEGAQAK